MWHAISIVLDLNSCRSVHIYWMYMIRFSLVWFGLVRFYDMSTIVGYIMPNPGFKFTVEPQFTKTPLYEKFRILETIYLRTIDPQFTKTPLYEKFRILVTIYLRTVEPQFTKTPLYEKFRILETIYRCSVEPRFTKTPLYEKFGIWNGLLKNFCPIFNEKIFFMWKSKVPDSKGKVSVFVTTFIIIFHWFYYFLIVFWGFFFSIFINEYISLDGYNI